MEVFGLCMMNTQVGGTRNIIIDKRRLYFITNYHKGFQHNNILKVIY